MGMSEEQIQEIRQAAVSQVFSHFDPQVRSALLRAMQARMMAVLVEIVEEKEELEELADLTTREANYDSW